MAIGLGCRTASTAGLAWASPKPPSHPVSVEFVTLLYQHFDDVANVLMKQEKETISFLRNGVGSYTKTYENGRNRVKPVG